MSDPRVLAELTKLESGYLHLWINGQIWAQWPPWETPDPRPEDCFRSNTHPQIMRDWKVLKDILGESHE